MGKRKSVMVLSFMAVSVLVVMYQRSNVRVDPLEPAALRSELLSCTPKKNIAFLKTHKTAGSTIQNIFMRYGSMHNLNFVLPLKGNYLGHPYHFQVQMAPRLKSGYHYNILTHHARFNYRAFSSLMPEDTVFVTVLRDPVTLFESLYSYYSLNKTYEMDIEDYAMSNLSDYLDHHNKRFYKKIGRNQMAFDLGILKTQFDDMDAIRDSIEMLDSQFDLVMISEMMDQSLVLLKHLLCWETDDIIAFRHNARASENKVLLSSDVQARIREWNMADQQIYDYFFARFQERVKDFGEDRMQKEVKELQERVLQWYKFCIESTTAKAELDAKFKVYSQKVLGFKIKSDVKNSTCEDLAKAELPFTNELRRKQRKYLVNIPSIPPQFFLRTF